MALINIAVPVLYSSLPCTARAQDAMMYAVGWSVCQNMISSTTIIKFQLPGVTRIWASSRKVHWTRTCDLQQFGGSADLADAELLLPSSRPRRLMKSTGRGAWLVKNKGCGCWTTMRQDLSSYLIAATSKLEWEILDDILCGSPIFAAIHSIGGGGMMDEDDRGGLLFAIAG
jgi:hypothetical protein